MSSRWLPFSFVCLTCLLGAPSALAGERVSHDVVIIAGDDARIANVVLGSSLSGNALTLSPLPLDEGGTGQPGIHLEGDENFSMLFGVNALALNSGHAAVQSVTINAYVVIQMPGAEGGALEPLFEAPVPRERQADFERAAPVTMATRPSRRLSASAVRSALGARMLPMRHRDTVLVAQPGEGLGTSHLQIDPVDAVDIPHLDPGVVAVLPLSGRDLDSILARGIEERHPGHLVGL